MKKGDCSVPYSTAADLMAYAEEHPMEAWEYGAYYESCRWSFAAPSAVSERRRRHGKF